MAPSANEMRLMDYDVFPSWTRGDESDDDSKRVRSGVRRQQRRRHRKRHNDNEEGVIRAETHQIDAATEFNSPEPTEIPGEIPGGIPPPPPPPPPPPAPTTTTTTTESAAETSSTTSDGPPPPTEVPSETTAGTSTTIETIPPLDQVTQTAPPPEPTAESDSDSLSESGDAESDSDPNENSEDEEGEDPAQDNNEGIVGQPDPITTGSDNTSFLLPTGTGTETSTTISASATVTEPPPSLDAARQAQAQHHRNVETALTVVGSVCGVVFLIVGAFFFWRIMKRRRRNRGLDGAHPLPLPEKPSRGARILAKVPILRDRFGNEAWVGIVDAPYSEKQQPQQRRPSQQSGFDILGYMPDQPAPAVLMTRGSSQQLGKDSGDFFGLTYAASHESPPSYYQTVPEPQDYQQQTMATQDYQGQTMETQPTRQSAYQPSESGSSLSSAFGNGTHIPPTPMQPLHPPPVLRQDDADLAGPNTRRDTTYTQMSVASSVPRFRTIHSWVRQQTSRIPQVPDPESQVNGSNNNNSNNGGQPGAEGGGNSQV